MVNFLSCNSLRLGILLATITLSGPAFAQDPPDQFDRDEDNQREEQERAFLEEMVLSLPAQIEAESRYYELITMPLLDGMIMEAS